LVRYQAHLALALVAALAAGACAVALAVAPTKVERWAPFANGTVRPGVHVVQTARGRCVGVSQVDARLDAWRCIAQGTADDPCFAGPRGFVLCPSGTPDSNDALKIVLTTTLPNGQAHATTGPTPGDPWAIKTANGDYCYRSKGTPTHLAGKTITYVCAGAAVLAGYPNRTGAVWTIELFPNAASSRYLSMAVQAAWW
jgi:uncharacterized membrane protein